MVLFTIVIIALMLGMAALLSATETAITASSPGKIQKLKSEGNKKAGIVLKILKTKEKVISTLLIGNSIINTVCTTIATGLFIELLGDDLGTIIASAVMSFLIIVFGEVIPKAIAVAKAEPIAIITASTITFFLKLLKPVNLMLEKVVDAFCFVFRIDLHQEVSGTDEVRGIIEHQHQEGHVYKADRDMLGGVLDIRGMMLSEIMVHRSNIFAINAKLPIDQIISTALASPHTRIPLWKDTKDNIIGILHIRDLLSALHQNTNISKIKIESLLSPPWFVPDNALVSHQLNEFRLRKNHFACVIDEYGDLRGIITLEDIIEEIVGQIHDEYDPKIEQIIQKSENEFLIDGAANIRDINRELNWDLPDEDATTIAGLIIHQLQHLPEEGEKIESFGLEITVASKVANRIKTVSVTVLDSKDVI